MDFSVNFLQKTTAVLQEAQKLKKYKAMPLAFAIIVGILMLPIALAALVCTVILYVFGYLFSVISLPVQRLHKLLREEGQGVHMATQVVIYFLSWTFVFSAYALLSFFLIVLTTLYSVFAILTYIWTLGGIKFHVFTAEESVAVDVDGQYKPLIPALFIAGMAVLLLVVPAFKMIEPMKELFEYLEYVKDAKLKDVLEYIGQAFKVQVAATGNWRLLFSALYSAFVFAPNPKKKAE